MTSRLDYSNALLSGCSAHSINKLQMVQNAAVRVLTRTRKYDHICPVLSTLHWLPIKQRIDFKILLITYKALNGLAPQYLSELWSQNSGHLIIPRIFNSKGIAWIPRAREQLLWPRWVWLRIHWLSARAGGVGGLVPISISSHYQIVPSICFLSFQMHLKRHIIDIT